MLKVFLIAVSLTMPAASGPWQQKQEDLPPALPVQNEIPNLFPDQNKKLTGTVVLFDSLLSSRTSLADFVVKTDIDGEEKYMRLLYAASGFGFDAPPAKPEQLLPQQMFADSHLIWTFKVHPPRTAEEQSACTSKQKRWEPAKGGGLVEVDRYTALPGIGGKQLPKPESLPCMILRSWSKPAKSNGEKR